jgi:hypothetical protein
MLARDQPPAEILDEDAGGGASSASRAVSYIK